MNTLRLSTWMLSSQRGSRCHSPLELIPSSWNLLFLLLACILMLPSRSEAFLQPYPSCSIPSISIHYRRNAHWPTLLKVAQELPHTIPPKETSNDQGPRLLLQVNHYELQEDSPKPSGIAIILNSNARGVSRDMMQAIQDLACDKIRVYTTSTYPQAQQAIRDMQKSPPQVVVPIGGDGTLTTLIQLFHDASIPLPYIGYLPMGTGNALGTVIGCLPKRRFRKQKRLQAIKDVLLQLSDIAQTMKQANGDTSIEHQVDIVEMPLMHVTTTSSNQTNKQQVYCFFAGIGFDSLMLQDYKELQEWSSKSRFWKDKFASVWGYTVALFTRTLPKCVAYQSHLVGLQVSTKKPALWVDHRRGDVVRKVRLDTTDKDGSSTLLYKGQAGIVAASTTPFYGGNLKLFPFARLSENGCQVRIGRIHPLVGVVNIPRIFSGAYRNSEMGCLDFIGTQFTVDISDGHPVQHSGESMGLAQHVELQVLKEPVKFVTLLPPRLVSETY